MVIVDTILKVGDWIQDKLKSKSGVFVLGAFMGSVPSSTVSYLLYRENKYKDSVILEEHERFRALEKEKDRWQERAFNVESTCLSRIKEMASFFQGLEDLYQHKENNSRKEIEVDEKELKKYEEITDKLNIIKKDLKNED